MKAFFLDRDGVINVEKEYLYKPQDLEFIDGVFDAMSFIAAQGFALFIITNQSGIARGLYTEQDYERLNEFMQGEFRARGLSIKDTRHCPHAPGSTCACRKPRPGMILDLASTHGVDLSASWLVGDKESDITAGLSAGVGHLVLVRSGHEINESATRAHFVCDNLAGVKNILESV
ncbi:MAG: D-glycero-beta-D-manno-heptose 1,7-bisphosphate 7-phosphatase [Helicobacteraceae bacterium]